MRPFIERLLPALLVVAVLIGVANLGAYAATGKPLILGQKNFSSKTTVLASKGDHATLRLLTNGGAPLSVEADSGRVAHLDADLVDGLDTSDFWVDGSRISLPTATSETGRLRYVLPVGFGFSGYSVSYSVQLETTGTGVLCYWEGDAGRGGVGNGVERNGRFTVSGTVLENGDDDPRFLCETEPGETLTMLSPSSFSAIRLNNLRYLVAPPACVPVQDPNCF